LIKQNPPPQPGLKSFAEESLKLVRVGKQPAELYDLSADVGESNNLAEAQPETVAALQKALDSWNAALMAPRWQNPSAAN
jgi:hypothetical protein